jgi:hypothetical protein
VGSLVMGHREVFRTHEVKLLPLYPCIPSGIGTILTLLGSISASRYKCKQGRR